MEVYSTSIQRTTSGFCDVHDITESVVNYLSEIKITEGLLTVFVPESTAAITTIEFEEGAIQDFKKVIEQIVPRDIHYGHNSKWGDGNGFSHVRAALLGPSLSVPISGSSLELGIWQQIILVDFDNRARIREVFMQVIGK